ncbi:MAG TPA: lytic transglycosylase F [Vicinamibacterales bacterium]|nr:lytic transglycosylase F [Vicinamibacterales bacterium]
MRYASRAVAAATVLVASLLLPAITAAQTTKPQTTPKPTPKTTAPAPQGGGQPGLSTDVVAQKWTGDLDGMVKRRRIRAGVVYNRTHYFVDKGVQRGIAYESLKLFEDDINKKFKTGNLKVHVVFVPLSREELLPALQDGRVDIVAAMLTVTPERQKLVDFSDPTRTGVNEVVVTGPGAPALATVDDLSGKEVFVRQSSSYFQSLTALNDKLKTAGKPLVVLKPAPETFEDDDILEMVNAGLVKFAVVDDYMATFWKQVFTAVTVRNDLALRTGGSIAVAMRKNSPQLMAEANAWIKRNGPKSLFGNTILNRYLVSTKFVKNATADADRARFETMVDLFKKYSAQYNLDWLLMAAQGYQESQLKQEAKSQVGAVGVMQVLPSTGADMKVGDVHQLDPNIHAGVKYIRFMEDTYFKNDPMDDLNKGLMAFASYNAGPGRIRTLRKEAAAKGLNPNVWFNNVEQVVSAKIGRETVTYVSNIYKYYIAYKLSLELLEKKKTGQN